MNETMLQSQEMRKRGISAIGWRYALAGVIIFGIQIFLPRLLRALFPELIYNIASDPDYFMGFSFGLVIFAVDIVGFPFVYLITKKLKKQKSEGRKLGIGQFILGLFYIAGIMFIGTIVGTALNSLATLPFGSNTDTNGLAELMLSSSLIPRALTVGVLAPIFEELIFRKVLVDCMLPYGKKVAILASGIMFGLFHGNLSQCFFAAGIGCFFAFIYVKTGKIWHSILYHMAINLTTSVISVSVVGNMYEAMNKMGINVDADTSEIMSIMGDGPLAEGMIDATIAILLAGIWVIFLIGFGIAGVVLLIVHRKKFTVVEEQENITKKQAAKILLTNPGMWLFYAVCIALFVYEYISALPK